MNKIFTFILFDGSYRFISCPDLQHAIEAVEAEHGNLVWAEQADCRGQDDDGSDYWRLLAWTSELEAQDDSGVSSYGQLSWTGDEC